MPVMNGIEAARNIRRKEKNGGKEIPIIAMTAQSERESKESCSLAGMNAYNIQTGRSGESDSNIENVSEALKESDKRGR